MPARDENGKKTSRLQPPSVLFFFPLLWDIFTNRSGAAVRLAVAGRDMDGWCRLSRIDIK